ncbi:MAG: acyl-CoA dehydrogenase family protein [Polyangiales bacterium]
MRLGLKDAVWRCARHVVPVPTGPFEKLRRFGFATRARRIRRGTSQPPLVRRAALGAAARAAKLGEMACELEAARLLVYRAAAAIDAGGDRGEVARKGSMAKLVATEGAQKVIDAAVQLHGGAGVLTTGIVARLYEEVRALRIYEGTNDVQKILIARELLR